MKRLSVGLASVLLVTAALSGTAVATHSNGEGPGKDFAVGAGCVELATPSGTFPSLLHINGMTDPRGGGGAQGNFSDRFQCTLTFKDTFGGSILCLTAISDGVLFEGKVESSSTPVVPVGFRIMGLINDNGEGADDPPDRAAAFLMPPAPVPAACPLIPVATAPISQGNFTVHDGI